MAAPQAAAQLPAGADWVYEPKWDGIRASVTTGPAPQVWSRHGKDLTDRVPGLVAAAAAVPQVAELDCELVAFLAGQVRFDAVTAHLRSPRAPGALIAVVFDLLSLDGEDLTGSAWAVRRARLAPLIPAWSDPTFQLIHTTEDLSEAQSWLTGEMPGVEGVVAKRRAAAYRVARGDWVKVRSRQPRLAVLVGFTGAPAAPRTLLVGLPDATGRVHVAGQTAQLPDEVRKQAGSALGMLRQERRSVAASRVGLAGGERVGYTAVEAVLVVEVEADTAFEAGRWRHPLRWSRWRPELSVGQVPTVGETEGGGERG